MTSLKPSEAYVVDSNSTLGANEISKRADQVQAASDVEDVTNFELDEYNSADEGSEASTAPRPSADPGLSSASLQLMQKLLANSLTTSHATLTDTIP